MTWCKTHSVTFWFVDLQKLLDQSLSVIYRLCKKKYCAVVWHGQKNVKLNCFVQPCGQWVCTSDSCEVSTSDIGGDATVQIHLLLLLFVTGSLVFKAHATIEAPRLAAAKVKGWWWCCCWSCKSAWKHRLMISTPFLLLSLQADLPPKVFHHQEEHHKDFSLPFIPYRSLNFVTIGYVGSQHTPNCRNSENCAQGETFRQRFNSGAFKSNHPK